MSAFVFITPAWDGKTWARHMQQAMPSRDIRVWPDMGNVSEIAYAAAWLPPPGVVKSLVSLKVIFSLGAGVDAILSDPTLPAGVPIVRVNDPDLTNRMSEYVVMHCLMHLRQHRRLDQQQQKKIWHGFDQPAAGAMTVGIMGLGVLGRDAALKLRVMGFNVAAWSRSRKSVSGVRCYASEPELDEFLGHTDILVCLLPATAETDGIINRKLIAKLSRSGPFGAPILINAGRGRQNNEADILAALDSGDLHAATLDVFRTEPLPADSPFWLHPKVTLTPHAAADSEPSVICAYVADQIARFERGETLQNLVDYKRGY
jgi:glyoxylate/hydroxypyruvate reductase A